MRACVCVCVRACGQCTRTCGGGVQFRSVTCVGGRACVPDEKPPEDRACSTRRCSSTDDETGSSSSLMLSTVAAEHPSDDVTPTRVPADSTVVARDDVTLSNNEKLSAATSVSDLASSVVTIATATDKTSTVIPSGAAVPQTTTTTATTTTAAAATTTTTAATTITRPGMITHKPLTSYRWMALFWEQVSHHLRLLYLILKLRYTCIRFRLLSSSLWWCCQSIVVSHVSSGSVHCRSFYYKQMLVWFCVRWNKKRCRCPVATWYAAVRTVAERLRHWQ